MSDTISPSLLSQSLRRTGEFLEGLSVLDRPFGQAIAATGLLRDDTVVSQDSDLMANGFRLEIEGSGKVRHASRGLVESAKEIHPCLPVASSREHVPQDL